MKRPACAAAASNPETIVETRDNNNDQGDGCSGLLYRKACLMGIACKLGLSDEKATRMMIALREGPR